ncbi:MAG: hypothetical protein ACXWB7_08745 [Kaistella sp.]
MSERFTNNSTLYREELIAKLEKPNEIAGHDFVFSYSIVSSFLTHVNCFLVYKGKVSSTLVIVKRQLDPRTIISNHGIFFPDKIKFTEFVFELDVQTSSHINSLLQNSPSAPNPLNHIILDGATFHIKNIVENGIQDFSWIHEEQLNVTAKELIAQFDKLI